MEHIFWCGFLELHVPHQSYPIRLMWGIFIIVIRCNHQFGVLERERKGKLNNMDNEKPTQNHIRQK